MILRSILRHISLFVLLAASALALALLAVACGGGDDGTPAPANSPASRGNGNGGGEVTIDMPMGDNFFELDGEKNPTLEIDAGAEVTINLDNQGTAVHAMRFAGDDNKYNTGDDAVSDPELVTAGQKAVITFTAPSTPGTYKYQCDFHPTDMLGEIVVK